MGGKKKGKSKMTHKPPPKTGRQTENQPTHNRAQHETPNWIPDEITNEKYQRKLILIRILHQGI